MHPAASCMVSGLFGQQMVRPCHRLSVCLSGTRVYCGQTGCTIELSFWHTPYHGNNNDVLGECPTVQIPSGAGLQAAKVWSEVSPNWPKICLVLTCNISETLHDMEYLYETTHALSVGEVTFERSNIAQFLLLCPALFYSALGTTKKWRGTVKKFSGNCAPPLLNCFRRHCSHVLL